MRSLHPWPTFPIDLDPPTSRSLSLLFVLQEFLSSCQLTQRLASDMPEEFDQISSRLDELLLVSLHNAFPQRGGAFDKLCFYSQILLQASKVEDATILTVLDEMRNAVMKVRSKVLFWRKSHPRREEVESELSELCGRLHHKLSSFFSSMILYLTESRTDENILLFLVEHRNELNVFLGPRKIQRLLSYFFPGGLHELRMAICEGYTRRGFSEFYARHTALLDDFEKEACECPSLSPMR